MKLHIAGTLRCLIVLGVLLAGCATPEQGYMRSASVVTFVKNLRLKTSPLGPDNVFALAENRAEPVASNGYITYADTWCAARALEIATPQSSLNLMVQGFRAYCANRHGQWTPDGAATNDASCKSVSDPSVVFFHAQLSRGSGCQTNVSVIEPTGAPNNDGYLRALIGFGAVPYSAIQKSTN